MPDLNETIQEYISGTPNLIRGTTIGEELIGSAGQDVINSDGGSDRIAGGDGRDLFVFEDGNGPSDLIIDFEPGPEGDVLLIEENMGSSMVRSVDLSHANDSAAQLANPDELLINDAENGVVITFDSGDTLNLLGVSVSELHFSNFDFFTLESASPPPDEFLPPPFPSGPMLA